MKHTYSEDFELLWTAYPSRGDAENSKVAAFRCYQARIREGLAPEFLLACVKGYAEAMRQKGKIGTEFIKLASTFLGRDRHYEHYEPGAEPVRPAAKKPIVEEERIDARPFLRELLAGLAKAKTSPVSNYVRSEK